MGNTAGKPAVTPHSVCILNVNKLHIQIANVQTNWNSGNVNSKCKTPRNCSPNGPDA